MQMINEILNALNNHRDERIKNLTKGEIDAVTMSVLFSSHIKEEMKGFEIQYLAPGLSGAGIVSVNPNIGLPFIIKYGKKDIIELEKNNYQKVISHIPHPILPVLREGSPLGNYNSVAYNWAGGRGRVENIRDFFNQASAEDMLRVISSLMNKLFEWYGIGTTTKKLMDQWPRSSHEIIDSVKERIENWDQDNAKKKKLLDILNAPQGWRDGLINKRFSSGNCHGDLNYRNILVVKDGKNVFPILIDFASCKANICPAKDWAKFEREIKFRFLRDAVSNPELFRKEIETLDTCCDNLSLIQSNTALEKAQKLISLVRRIYSQKRTNISDTPHIEYLIFLFYTTLTYAVHEEIKEQPAIQNTVIDSAYRIMEQIDKILSTQPAYKYPGIPELEEPAEIPLPVILQIPATYKTWIETECLKMELSKLVEDQDREVFVRIKMPEIFIPLYAADPERKESPERGEREPVDIEELISRYDQLVVRGQAGSGKTTLIKHLAYTVINQNNPFGINDCLPVLVFLNDLQKIVRGIHEPIAGAPLAERFMDEYFKVTGNGLNLQIVNAYSKAHKTVFLFDGLDEIEPVHRKIVVDSLIGYTNKNPGNKLLFSGRPSGIDADVLQPLSRQIVDINGLVSSQKEAFLEKWFMYISSLREKGKTPQMVMGEIESHPYVKDLTETPLMMTAICILYHYDSRLPEQRAELYERFINNLIFKRFKDADSVRSYLMKLAFDVHRSREKKFDWALAIKTLKEIYPDNNNLEKKFEEIDQKCGLLKIEDNQYTFWHPTFREFLSARYMVVLETDYAEAVKDYWTDDWYQEVIKLFVGFLNVNHNVGLANKVVSSGLSRTEKTPYKRWRLAAEALIDIPENNRTTETLKLAKERLQEILANEDKAEILANAGESLGWLGDTRDLKEFIPIRGGDYDLEGLGKVEIEPFEIGKYPVTNLWFDEFIKADGYKNLKYWSREGRKWLEHTKAEYPSLWNERKWICPNSPVVGVCWYEADAFAKWLTSDSKYSAGGKYVYRLPDEYEWQAAAAGFENRECPCGEWAKDRCNTSESHIGKTSPVGIFKNGDTPEGVSDMAGNVWEWTKSDYNLKKELEDFKFYEDYSFAKDRELQLPVLRGGSWNNNQDNAQCDYRNRNNPDNRNNNIGFRCVRTKK